MLTDTLRKRQIRVAREDLEAVVVQVALAPKRPSEDIAASKIDG